MLESELFALLERTSDAAFCVTEEGEIQSWNSSAERLFGYSRSQALHKTCYQLLEGFGPLGTRVCHQHCSVAECAGRDAEIPNFDMSVKTNSGERLWINMSTVIFENSRTGRRMLIHLAHDITAQKFSEELTQKMLDLARQLGSTQPPPGRAAPAVALSEQEKQVLRLFAEGKSSTHISRTLHISSSTLRNHLHHINQKLRTHNRLEAVMNAIQRKLI
jgi:PAS domain S-box-containing protein